MKTHGLASISDLLGDDVVYRSLNPVNEKLPGLETIRKRNNWPDEGLPRKTTKAYARVILEILKDIQALRGEKSALRNILLVGDSRLNDGGAFFNICSQGNVKGLAFIGSESNLDPEMKMEEKEGSKLFSANRWTSLYDFMAIDEAGFAVDEKTAVLLDLDKTAIGARGRNDHVIDQVRLEAAHNTAKRVLERDYDKESINNLYFKFNQPRYHKFTTDNQDFLVYLCLMIDRRVIHEQKLDDWLDQEPSLSFDALVAYVQERIQNYTPVLQDMNRRFYWEFERGNPTPFTTFRAFEYKNTLARMGQIPDEVPLVDRMQEEIVLTREVQQAIFHWRDQGAIVLGISDKPDEASRPGEEDRKAGMIPIHRKKTHVVGV